MTKIEFKFAVVYGEIEVGIFLRLEDAESFKQADESIIEISRVMDFNELSIPRKNLEGERSSSAQECIGVW
jgi:hypothetical protein